MCEYIEECIYWFVPLIFQAILLVEKKVTSVQQILPLLEQVMRDQRPLVIIAEVGYHAIIYSSPSSKLCDLSCFPLHHDLCKPAFGCSHCSVFQDLESEALAALVVNKLRAGLKVAAVKAPGFGDNRKAGLQDIAVLTGGTVVTEEAGMKLADVTPDMLGSCKTLKMTCVLHPPQIAAVFPPSSPDNLSPHPSPELTQRINVPPMPILSLFSLQQG